MTDMHDENRRSGASRGWALFVAGLVVGAVLVIGGLWYFQPRAVRDLMVQRAVDDAKLKIQARDFDGALTDIDRVLQLDPSNDFATAVRSMVEDRALVAQQRKARERYDQNVAGPTSAPQPANMAQQAVLAQLERRMPEVRFENVGFADALDFIRDVTTAKIVVDWDTLKAAGVDRDWPVTVNMRDIKCSTALSAMIRDLGSHAGAKLSYVVEDGEIRISTEQALQSATRPATRASE